MWSIFWILEREEDERYHGVCGAAADFSVTAVLGIKTSILEHYLNGE